MDTASMKASVSKVRGWPQRHFALATRCAESPSIVQLTMRGLQAATATGEKLGQAAQAVKESVHSSTEPTLVDKAKAKVHEVTTVKPTPAETVNQSVHSATAPSLLEKAKTKLHETTA
jgi:hypothetical protein